MEREGRNARHYYQGGYDYEFVDEGLRDRFECPICLLCLRDPHQTSCGHRFCYSCILTWLREGKTCPKDNCTLGEGDLFPDPMAHREILQLRVRCPTRKQQQQQQQQLCPITPRLADAENHADQCHFNKSKRRRIPSSATEDPTCETCGESVQGESAAADGEARDGRRRICPNERVACPYTSAGCEEKIPRKDLDHHEKTQVQKHLKLLCERMLKLQQTQGSAIPVVQTTQPADASSFANGSNALASATAEDGYLSGSESLPGDEGGMIRAEALRLSGSNLQSTHKLLRDLFHRQVQQEQKGRHLQIANERLNARVAEMQARMEDMSMQDSGRFCQGRFLWRLSDFSLQHQRMRQDRTLMLYSPTFYTSPFGYKLCLRCNVSIDSGEEHLGVFAHLMSGENDDCLKWPFRGDITIAIVNLQHERPDLTMNTSFGGCSADNAFSRPTSNRNSYGYGLKSFARLNSLYSQGYVGNDDFLAIRAVVTEDGEEGLVRDQYDD